MTYQTNTIIKNPDGTTTITTTTIIADSVSAAYETTAADRTADPNTTTRIYPLADIRNGDSIETLAEHVVRAYERWERRNDYACDNPRKRTPDQRDDLRQTAALAIVETLTADPDAPMYTVARAATTAIRTYQASLDRRSERSVEFDPDWTVDVLAPTDPHPTYPELNDVLHRAIAAAHLTADQKTYVHMVYFDGVSIHDTANRLGRDRNTIRKVLYAAQYKIMAAATADPTTADAFAAAGIDAGTLADVLTAVKRKARVK